VNSVAVLDVGHNSPYNHGPSQPMLWGMLGLLAIESTVFSCLIATYFFTMMGSPQWPPAGVSPPDLLLPTINTFILIASSFPVHYGDAEIKKGNKKGLQYGWLAGSVLALVFLALKVYEYGWQIDYRWDTHAYGSITWGITFFHSLHVVSLVMKTVVVDVLAFRGYYNAERYAGVTINGMYWHFVVGVWIPLYLTIYWSPRIL
jgi:cytochrome c oxidase subunit III